MKAKNIFFLGIGGIGMSALARYFQRQGYHVSGYDRTPSELTGELEAEGIEITYEDDPSIFHCPLSIFHSDNTLVVRTPAVPEDSLLYRYFREHGFQIKKRAEVLGDVTRRKQALCVAGTHGKTTTSTMIAHLLQPVNAFLGGISMNYGTNVLIEPDSPFVVVEADEYDRSFHQLTPYISVVTAVDPDHLDIYGTPEAYREAFAHYTSLITGALVMKHGIALESRLQPGVKCYTYGVILRPRDLETSKPDFYATNIRVGEGTIVFDFVTPRQTVKDIRLGVPVWVNIENAVAAMAVAYLVGKNLSTFNSQLSTFKGVQRRFNIHVHTPKIVYIDDYAHHPQEIATAIDSIRKLFPERRLIGVFQPHLYTRTRDFKEGFTRVLATLDECLLLPIYPAREEPIPGVTSEILLANGQWTMENGKLVEKQDLVPELKRRIALSQQPVVILTVGAGDIDRLVPEITKSLNAEY
ncbi:MAG: UDP-N-acetylmuramate--L-alanine ligase [Paludibacteraceae bacterium]|nr:UDP-N-acetylmuramate--L-alanine ligase [Paludibacteraceae bacterium]